MAALFGDPNPLHMDRSASRTVGCDLGLVNRGPTSIAFVMNGLLEHCAESGLEISRLKVRLRSPVQGTDCVVFTGRIAKAGSTVPSPAQPPPSSGDDVYCEVWLDRVDGRRAIDGVAVLRGNGQAQPAELLAGLGSASGNYSSAWPGVSLCARPDSRNTTGVPDPEDGLRKEAFRKLSASNYEIKGETHDYVMPLLQAPTLKQGQAHPIFAYYAAQAAFGPRVDAMYSQLGVDHSTGMLLGEVELHLARQIHIGEVLGVYARIGAPARKSGRSGKFSTILQEVWLHDSHGTVAFLAVTLIIPA